MFSEKEDLTSLESSFYENNENLYEKIQLKRRKKKEFV